jgi:hypothetical protein
MTTTTPRSNRYPGICLYCGKRIAAGDGLLDGSNVYCYEGEYDDWLARENEARARAVRANADAVAVNRFLVRFGLGWIDPAAAERNRRALEVQNLADARGEKVCGRCGGAGGSSHWPGYTCYDCGGRGTMPDLD